MIEVKRTKKYGRGLYATRPIKKGEEVEVSPIVVLKDRDNEHMGKLALYVFAYRHRKGSCCLALGYGSLFNHRSKPNVAAYVGRDVVRFSARRNIRKGEQLFIDYGYNPKDFKYLHDE